MPVLALPLPLPHHMVAKRPAVRVPAGLRDDARGRPLPRGAVPVRQRVRGRPLVFPTSPFNRSCSHYNPHQSLQSLVLLRGSAHPTCCISPARASMSILKRAGEWPSRGTGVVPFDQIQAIPTIPSHVGHLDVEPLPHQRLPDELAAAPLHHDLDSRRVAGRPSQKIVYSKRITFSERKG